MGAAWIGGGGGGDGGGESEGAAGMISPSSRASPRPRSNLLQRAGLRPCPHRRSGERLRS